MEKLTILKTADICVCCGRYVPKGEQVCWQCRRYDEENFPWYFCSAQNVNYHGRQNRSRKKWFGQEIGGMKAL